MALVDIVKSGSSAQYDAAAGQKLYTYAPGNGRDTEGRVHRQYFNVTLASQASGSTFGLAILPAGARIFGVTWIQSATFGATATLAIGLTSLDGTGTIDGTIADSDNAAKGFFRAAATQTTTTILTFGQTVALGWGYVTTKELALTFTVGAADLPSSGTVVGYVDYILAR